MQNFTSIAPQLHHERGVGRRSDASSRKADNRQPFQTRSLLKEVEWDTQLLCIIVELFLGHNSCSLDSRIHGARMTNGLR